MYIVMLQPYRSNLNALVWNANRIIAMLEKTGVLKIASVGDCGLKVIRKG